MTAKLLGAVAFVLSVTAIVLSVVALSTHHDAPRHRRVTTTTTTVPLLGDPGGWQLHRQEQNGLFVMCLAQATTADERQACVARYP